jgi:16S rRNA (guanine527-N7)-methyltransferase
MRSVPPVVWRAAHWAGLELTDEACARLITFEHWLRTEAAVAGGIGPREAERLWERHIADSLLLGFPWGTTAPRSLGDLGSGVGLPGIPLALVFPRTSVTLVERSGRRCTLLRRVARILDLEVQVVRTELGPGRGELGPFDAVVSRAAFPPDRASLIAARLLAPGGTAVLALRRGGQTAPPPVSSPDDVTTDIVRVPAAILDDAVWLLRMHRRDDRRV